MNASKTWYGTGHVSCLHEETRGDAFDIESLVWVLMGAPRVTHGFTVQR